MIATNEAPELTRIRAALRIEWKPYQAWVDGNYQRANAIGQLALCDGEEPDPIIKAQFVFETWMRSDKRFARPRVRRDILRIRSGVRWVRAILTASLVLAAQCARLP